MWSNVLGFNLRKSVNFKQQAPGQDQLFLFSGAIFRINLHFSPRSSREVGKCCGYKARAEKQSQAYCQYVENVF